MTVNQRLKIILDALNLNPNSCGVATGIPVPTIRRAVNGTNVPGVDVFERILEVFPQVSAEFLFRGVGKPLKNETSVPEMQIIRNEPASNTGVIVATQTLDRVVTVPMVNVKAAANYVSGYQTQEYFEALDAAVLPMDFTRGRHSLLLQVDGDSMQPTYFDRQWVLGSYVEKSDWLNIADLEAYIIVSKEKGIQVKRVKNRFPEGFIRCRSDNRKHHRNFSLDFPDILEIWRVTAYFTNYMPNLADDLFWKVDHIDEQQQDLRVMYENMLLEMKEIKKQLKE